jgi:hypothetical protein
MRCVVEGAAGMARRMSALRRGRGDCHLLQRIEDAQRSARVTAPAATIVIGAVVLIALVVLFAYVF